jgi:hypothetical protein
LTAPAEAWTWSSTVDDPMERSRGSRTMITGPFAGRALGRKREGRGVLRASSGAFRARAEPNDLELRAIDVHCLALLGLREFDLPSAGCVAGQAPQPLSERRRVVDLVLQRSHG